MYRRSDNPADPWISLEDHFVSIDNATVLYSSYNYYVVGSGDYDDAAEALTTYGGADVYIRNRADCTGFVDYHSHSQTNASNFAYVNENNILILDTDLPRKEDF